jgi:SecD/SecF fusion protein
MSDYFDRVEQRIVRSVQEGASRPRRARLRLDLLVPAVSVAVAVVIAAVFLSVRGGTGKAHPTATTGQRTVLLYRAERTAQSRVDRASLARAIAVMRVRVSSLGISGARFRIVGGDSIRVSLPTISDLSVVEQRLGADATLEFYDWEANALTPTGQTVSKLLLTGDPTALQISQGSARSGPGGLNSGGMTLYDAVKLAAKQPLSVNKEANSRRGGQFFLFAQPKSAACKTAAKDLGTVPDLSQPCLLEAPISGLTNSAAIRELKSSLPLGVSYSQGQLLVVKQGTVVLQAVPSSYATGQWPAFGSLKTQYFVLRDNVALFGKDITNPVPSTDQTGLPDVSFGFTSAGAHAFESVTAAVATRGEQVSIGSQKLFQHFAVALDDQLVTVPSIDYMQNPDGIPGNSGAEITGPFTRATARAIATELRLAALPIELKLVRVLHLGS